MAEARENKIIFIKERGDFEMKRKKKLILLTQSLEDQLEVGRLLNSIIGKIENKKNINDGIILSFKETQLIQNIVVSIGS